MECSIKKTDVENSYYIPNVKGIFANIVENINQMFLPLQTFSDTAYQKDKRDPSKSTNSKAIEIADYDNLRNRFKDLLARFPENG